MFLPVLLAKFLSAGAIAQAATGAGVVVVVVTGAGAAGVLPGPLQDVVSSTVENVTPSELPASDDDVSPVGDPEGPAVIPAEIPLEEPVDEPVVEPVVEPVAETPTEDGTTAKHDIDLVAFETWKASLAEGVPFGTWISDGARQGFISYWVHLLKEQRRAAQATTPAVPTEDVEDEITVEDGDDDEAETSDRHGKDHGNGNGNGHRSGHGESKGGEDNRDGDRKGDRNGGDRKDDNEGGSDDD